jgi:Tat protein translocase TatB subunit
MLSIPHLIIIFIVALIVLGPDKLPHVARTLGKIMAEFRRITGDFRVQMERELNDLDRQSRLRADLAMHEADIASALEPLGPRVEPGATTPTIHIPESIPPPEPPPATDDRNTAAPPEKPEDA